MNMETHTRQAQSLAALGLPTAPYRGIESFRLVDRSIFRARDRDVRSIFRLSGIYRAIIVSGDSGVGKSSLLNAGLIPALVEDGSWIERMRVQPIADKEFLVERLSLGDDGKHPFLPSIFAPDDLHEAKLSISASELVGRLRACLRDEEQGPSHPPIVHLCDQFEESVTLFEEAPESREAFHRSMNFQRAMFGAIAELITDEELNVKLIFAMRDDYLPKVQRHFERFYPQIKSQVHHLDQLTEADLAFIIEGPYKARAIDGQPLFTRRLKEQTCHTLEAGLQAKSDNGYITLTETQIACRTLWDDPEEEALFNTASEKANPASAVQHLYDQHMENSMKALSDREQRQAKLALTKLITSSGTRNIVSRDDLFSTLATENINEQDAEGTMETLTKRTRLVYLQARSETPFYEIVSESLIPWIQEQAAVFQEEKRQAEEAERRLAKMAADKAEEEAAAARVEQLKRETQYQEELRVARAAAAEFSDKAASIARSAEEQATRAAKDAQRHLAIVQKSRTTALVLSGVTILIGILAFLITQHAVADAKGAKDRLRELEEQEAVVSQELEETKKRSASAQALVEQTKKALEELERALAEARSESQTLKNELQTVKKSFDEIEAKNSELLVSILKFRLESAKDDPALTARIQAVVNQVTTSTSDIRVAADLIKSTTAKLDRASNQLSELGWQKGKIKIFGGPQDQGRTDSLAFIHTKAQAALLGVFLPQLSTPPRVSELNPDSFYIAARWEYGDTPKEGLLKTKARVRNSAGLELDAQPVDWGPSPATGAIMDISPGLAKALELKPGDEASFYMDKPPSNSGVTKTAPAAGSSALQTIYTMDGINAGRTRPVPSKLNWYVWVGKLSGKDQSTVDCRVFQSTESPASFYTEKAIDSKIAELQGGRTLQRGAIGVGSPLYFIADEKKYELSVISLTTGLFKNDHVDLRLIEE